MSDKDFKNPDHDEYQYPNEEYVEETVVPEEKAEPSGRFHFIKRFVSQNRRVTIVLALIVVVLLVLKIVGHHAPKVPPVVEKPVVAAVVEPNHSALIDTVRKLETASQEQRETVAGLQGRFDQVSNQMDALSQEQAQLNQTLNNLTQSLKTLTQTVGGLAAKQAGTGAKKTTKPVVFYLKAIVPGRAWILSDDGLSESVGVGTTVPQYGTVEKIDADRGMVLTSSGKIIEYGPNDH